LLHVNTSSKLTPKKLLIWMYKNIIKNKTASSLLDEAVFVEVSLVGTLIMNNIIKFLFINFSEL